MDENAYVIAIAIDVCPARQLQTRNGSSMIQEVILIGQLLKPIILTMWDQFVTNESAAIAQTITTRPIIMAIRLKVVSHNGLFLSTRSSSSFIIDPRIPEATALQTWMESKILKALSSFPLIRNFSSK
ncbi:hypothetical protein SO802_017887 [Lithocarpus litseifolius]|uniref:Uncharacterized protein n=1 Tax=Lithocarpus litseifolius TaxID=425828 RepID=A0AAW2CNK2_9ROSI